MNFTIGLVGNPNCGKTTVFNALTGARQRVGNWPGVTVERKSGFFKWQNTNVEVVDLPGIYSLTVVSDTSSIDERIACEYILNQHADVIVNILDASNLERNLYLTTQLIEMNVPIIVVVNMMDIARKRRTQISLEMLANELGCPVIPLEAHKSKGIKDLKQMVVATAASKKIPHSSIIYPDEINQALHSLAERIHCTVDAKWQTQSHWIAMRLFEEDVFARSLVSSSVLESAAVYQNHVKENLSEDIDILLADARYRFIQTLMKKSVVKSIEPTKTWTARIDRVVLNRFLGIPIFLCVMYGLFLFAINVGGAFQDFFDIGSNTIFVDGFSVLLMHLNSPMWLTALLANGFGKGINTTLTFIPVIGAMFLFLALLEDSGYMARAAFVVDRCMRALGLPGKSFVPMIVGFGCNVPAVMAARTLDSKRDRVLTVMMSPFMSCGARLAIYAVFTAAFFPVGGQNVIFILYLTGIVMAVLTGLLLRKTILKGEPSPLVMELPPYHLPNLKSLFLHAWQRLKGFVFRAGKLIVPICILIGALNTLNIDGTMNAGEGDSHSILSTVGQWVTPIFSPMGIHQDNWPATVGLVTGVLAKEVVVGTLNTLYSQMGHLNILQAGAFSFWGGLHDAVMSIPVNLSQLGNSLGNPVLAKAPVHTLQQGVYGMMFNRFDGQLGAMAYLLFVLLYFPCVSTTAVMVRELNRTWTLFSVLWTTGIAYGAAVIFYQAGTFLQHPFSSFCWIILISTVLIFFVNAIRAFASRDDELPIVTKTILIRRGVS